MTFHNVHWEKISKSLALIPLIDGTVTVASNHLFVPYFDFISWICIIYVTLHLHIYFFHIGKKNRLSLRFRNVMSYDPDSRRTDYTWTCLVFAAVQIIFRHTIRRNSEWPIQNWWQHKIFSGHGCRSWDVFSSQSVGITWLVNIYEYTTATKKHRHL